MVVHPVVLGADLREHPQRRGVPAARGGLQARWRQRVPRVEQRSVLRVRGDGAPRRLSGVTRHGGVRESPEVLFLRRHGGARGRLPGDAVRLSERVPERVQPGNGEPVRRERRRVHPDHRDGDHEQRRADRAGARIHTLLRSDAAARPVPVLLDPVAELGRDPLWRGPRRERFQARHERDDVGSVGHRRRGVGVRLPLGQVLRVGVLQRREPELLGGGLRVRGSDDAGVVVSTAAWRASTSTTSSSPR